jgi:hypothetical protein
MALVVYDDLLIAKPAFKAILEGTPEPKTMRLLGLIDE